MGNLLPDGPEGNKEILGVWGGRFSVQSSETLAYEFGGLFGAQAPVTWQNLFVNVRHDIPVQGFMAHVGAGGDVIRMTTKLARYDDNGLPILDYAGNQDYTHVKRILVGMHILGGAKAHLIGPIWGRADMKLNFVPALILTITGGIELRFDEAKK